MSKRLSVNLTDDVHAQIKERASEAGLSVGAWLTAAVEREAFRQLCELQGKWNLEHPEEVAKANEDFRRREAWRASHAKGHDTSAA